MRPWSYSRYDTWDGCPKQYWYSYIENVPSFRPPSPSADRGQRVHAEAEAYLRHERSIYPPELQRVAGHAMSLKIKKAEPEVKIAVREDWTRCEWDDPDAYFRGILDVLFLEDKICHIQDWKTGQIYADHPKQLETYVPLAAVVFPEAEEFYARLIYVDQGVVTPPKKYARERVKPIRIMLDAGIANAEADTIYPVKPGPGCKWCGYSQRHGGPCPH